MLPRTEAVADDAKQSAKRREAPGLGGVATGKRAQCSYGPDAQFLSGISRLTWQAQHADSGNPALATVGSLAEVRV